MNHDIPQEWHHSEPDPGPSTSTAVVGSSADDVQKNAILMLDQMPQVDESQLQASEPAEASLIDVNSMDLETVINMNEAYIEIVNKLLEQVRTSQAKVKRKIEGMQQQIADYRANSLVGRKKIPITQYLPPYFKDASGMWAPSNDEARIKAHVTSFDPLIKDEKKWRPDEIKCLLGAIRSSLLEKLNQQYINKRTELELKIQSCGSDTTQEERQGYQDEIEVLNRKIEHNLSLPDQVLFANEASYDKIDWLKISNVDFQGNRTAAAVRLKWMNELRPRWNQDPKWTPEELKKLKELREDPNFSSWLLLADRLQTKRTPWQCFVKYKTQIATGKKPWTREEDEKLVSLVKMLSVDGKIPWDKVAYFMPGRSRQHVQLRYKRSLDKNVKHGHWTDHEDLLLMCAVDRYGPKEWAKVAKIVSSRTDVQCRERWTTVLDRRMFSKEWSLLEDEKLLHAVSIVGKGKWTKCSELLEGRSPLQCRHRFEGLLTAKIRMTLAVNSNPAELLYLRPSSALGMLNRKFVKHIRQEKIINHYLKTTGNPLDSQTFLKKAVDSTIIKKRSTNNLTDEEREIVAKGFKEIDEKYARGEKTDYQKLLKDIPIDESGVIEVLRREASRRFIRLPINRQKPKLQRIGRTLADYEYRIPESFSKDTPEAERAMIMMEGLCSIVKKLDLTDWKRAHRNHWKEGAPQVAEHFMIDTLDQAQGTLAPSSSTTCGDNNTGSNDSLALTLPPSMTTCGVYRRAQIVRAKLTQTASFLFRPLDVEVNGPSFLISGHDAMKRKYEMDDRLNIQIHEQITSSNNFKDLKARLRILQAETAKFTAATEGSEASALASNMLEQRRLRESEVSSYERGELDVLVIDDQDPGSWNKSSSGSKAKTKAKAAIKKEEGNSLVRPSSATSKAKKSKKSVVSEGENRITEGGSADEPRIDEALVHLAKEVENAASGKRGQKRVQTSDVEPGKNEGAVPAKKPRRSRAKPKQKANEPDSSFQVHDTTALTATVSTESVNGAEAISEDVEIHQDSVIDGDAVFAGPSTSAAHQSTISDNPGLQDDSISSVSGTGEGTSLTLQLL